MARGGKRDGAGRRPGARSTAQAAAIDIAGEVLKTVNAKEKWIALLKCGEPKVIADVMKYLTDRVHGKPSQSLQLQGDKDKPLEVIIRVIGA